MYVMKPVMRVRSVLSATAIMCALFTGNIWAADRTVTVAIHVNTQGLDLSQPDAARLFYARLERSACVVCTHGNRVDLVPDPAPVLCYEKALGDAIRSVNRPMLTVIYLETHTLRQAAARGIQVPSEFAAK